MPTVRPRENISGANSLQLTARAVSTATTPVSRRLILCILGVLSLGGCGAGSEVNFRWDIAWPTTEPGRENLLFLMGGFWETIQVSLLALVFSVALGLLFALLGLSPYWFLRAIARVYTEVFRSVPSLVLILWVFYGLPVLLSIKLNPFNATIIALALAESGFIAEIFRGGIISIERGQFEAASALGLNKFHRMRYVILPQAVRRILPPMGNQFIYILKMSSLASIIGLTELTRRANVLSVATYRPLEIYTYLVIEYLALVLVASVFVRMLERRLGADGRTGGVPLRRRSLRNARRSVGGGLSEGATSDDIDVAVPG